MGVREFGEDYMPRGRRLREGLCTRDHPKVRAFVEAKTRYVELHGQATIAMDDRVAKREWMYEKMAEHAMSGTYIPICMTVACGPQEGDMVYFEKDIERAIESVDAQSAKLMALLKLAGLGKRLI